MLLSLKREITLGAINKQTVHQTLKPVQTIDKNNFTRHMTFSTVARHLAITVSAWLAIAHL